MRPGKYTLLRKLATGGMGEVFLGLEEGVQDLVVIKRVLPIHVDNEDIVEMFLDEGRIATLMKHPNIVEAHRLDRMEGADVLVMEYVPGKDLQRICQRGVKSEDFLSLRMACKIISEAARALDYVHTRTDEAGQPLNIVHRDISPPNIIVSYRGEVKLLDFGIAKAKDNQAISGDEHFKGKFGYMSPEQCQGIDLDHRSDIFALGTLLYEITAQTRLFRARDRERAMALICEARVAPPTLTHPGYPEALEQIVLKALARDREERFQSAGALHLALEVFLETQGAPVTQQELAGYIQRLFASEVRQWEATVSQVISVLDLHPESRDAPEPLANDELPVPEHGEDAPTPEPSPISDLTPAPSGPSTPTPTPTPTPSARRTPAPRVRTPEPTPTPEPTDEPTRVRDTVSDSDLFVLLDEPEEMIARAQRQRRRRILVGVLLVLILVVAFVYFIVIPAAQNTVQVR